MSTTTLPAAPSQPIDKRQAAALAVVALVLVSFWLGRSLPGPVHWQTMDAQLYRDGEVVVFVDDRGVGRFEFESSVPEWIDASGSRHTGGMPECLVMPGAETLPSWELVVEDVRFGTVRVADGDVVQASVVVAVDCRA